MRVLCIVWRARVAEAVGSSGLRAWALGRGGSSFSIQGFYVLGSPTPTQRARGGRGRGLTGPTVHINTERLFLLRPSNPESPIRVGAIGRTADTLASFSLRPECGHMLMSTASTAHQIQPRRPRRRPPPPPAPRQCPAAAR